MSKEQKFPKYPPASILKFFERFRFFLNRFARKLTPPNVAIIELTQNFYVSRAIGVAAEYNLAEIIGNNKLPVSDIAKESETNEEALYRLMRMLSSQGIFKELPNKYFKNNNLSKTLLDRNNSMRHMIIHQVNGINWNMFEELNYVVKTGKNAAEKILGMDVFSYLEKNPDKNEIYNHAMTNSSLMLSYAILSEYSFKKSNKIIDIGGGQGTLLAMILSKYKHITGSIFDLPHVVKDVNKIANEYDINDRLEAISGNFFESVPTGADTYMLKSIIHNLSDDQCASLLKKIKKVLPYNGKILIIEPIVEDNNRYSFAKLYDIQMLVGRSGGKERTKEEYGTIIKDAGLKLNRIVQTAAPFSILEINRN